jgi:hypothetical protein
MILNISNYKTEMVSKFYKKNLDLAGTIAFQLQYLQ